MLELSFDTNNKKALNILLLGAHCDDIEIGCGGAILKMIEKYQINKIKWVVFASNDVRKKEAIKCAKKFLNKIQQKEIVVFDYKDAFLESFKFEIKEYFESMKTSFNPDIIFTHYRNDRHQDHRLISDLTWNTFRNHFILEYEIPKYDGDFGQPNFFVRLSEKEAIKKVNLIIDSYASQIEKHWFDRDTFLSLMRLRAIESANSLKYSEAFYARKSIL